MAGSATKKLRGLAEAVPPQDPASIPLGRQSILLYGEPKIGKTTLASKFENALFCDTESGTLNFRVPTFEQLIGKDRVKEPIRSWVDIRKATKVLGAIKDVEGTIIVDTVPEAYTMCRVYVLDKEGLDHETDLEYGKGWTLVKDEFSSWIRELKGMGFGIVFIAHVNDEQIEDKVAKLKYTKKIPRMSSGCKSIIEPLVDHIWYAHQVTVKGEDQQVIRTKPTRQVTAGERGDEPRLQALLPMDYETIKTAWEGGPGSIVASETA